MARDFEAIRKYTHSRIKKMFERFDQRRDILLETAKEWDPLLVPGLELGVEELADGWKFDDDHRMLTTIPVQTLRKSAGGFLANMMSPSRPWFDFQLRDSSDDTDHDVRLALNELKKATEASFQKSNAYGAGYTIFKHLLTVGFGCMLVRADNDGNIRCQTLRVGTYALDIDDTDGLVDKVARRFGWTASHILEEFGEEWVPEFIKDEAKKGSNKRYEVWNLIEPNPKGFMRNFDPLEKDKADITDEKNAYRSIYLLKGGSSQDRKLGDRHGILRLTGYRHNPIIAPRLEYENGDTYGLGRCIDGLYNARGVQTFKGDELRVTGLRSQPPVVVAGDFKNRVQLGRKGVNIVKNGEQADNRVVPVFGQLPDASDTRESFRESKEELESLLFVDAFAVIDSIKNNPGKRTATEIEYLKTENLSKLGAIYIDLTSEMFDPLVNVMATYTYEVSKRLTDETRKALKQNGVVDGFDVEYVSQIALAQKAGALTSVQQYTQYCLGLMDINPATADNIDVDKTLRLVGRMLNVPEEVNRSEKEIKLDRAARAQNAAQMAQAEKSAKLAAAAKQVGDIPLDGTHLGGAIAEGLAG